MSVKKRRLYWLMLVAAFCAAAVTFGVFLWNRDRPDDEKRLQGVWVNDETRLTIDGNLAVLEGLPELRRNFFRLNPRASPKRIILCDADGPTRSQWLILGMEFGPPTASNPKMECNGIYELDGDWLRFCLPPGGTDFPKSFDAKTIEFHRP